MKQLFAIVLALFVAVVMLDAKGQKTPVGSLSIGATSDLHWGGFVWFDWTTNNGPWHDQYIDVACYQEGTPDPNSDAVYGWGSYAFDQGESHPFPLSTSFDPTASGSCLARLYLLSYQGQTVFLDTINFTVDP